jgi:hypothetical protein
MEKRLWSRWKVAIDLLDKAMKESGYLKAATMSLQTALLFDGCISYLHPNRINSGGCGQSVIPNR